MTAPAYDARLAASKFHSSKLIRCLAELDMAGDIDTLAAVDPVGQAAQDERLKGPPRGRREFVCW